MTRTPPPTQPNGYEKSDHCIYVKCTATEHLVWSNVFGSRKLPDAMRKLMNKEAMRKCGMKVKGG